jgi:hypothetical protein
MVQARKVFKDEFKVIFTINYKNYNIQNVGNERIRKYN